jgi:RpiB/LacA/LacB family sugar-phosphate isomerase
MRATLGDLRRRLACVTPVLGTESSLFSRDRGGPLVTNQWLPAHLGCGSIASAMRIAMASDHAGFERKNELRPFVESLGHEVLDFGAYSEQPGDDYPDYAEAVGMAVKEHRADRGVLICGSGVGVSVAASKIPGIRAAVCHDAYSAHQGVEHDDMNVLVIGSRIVAVELAKEVVHHFLNARFSGEERHLRRLAKVRALEARFSSGSA